MRVVPTIFNALKDTVFVQMTCCFLFFIVYMMTIFSCYHIKRMNHLIKLIPHHKIKFQNLRYNWHNMILKIPFNIGNFIILRTPYEALGCTGNAVTIAIFSPKIINRNSILQRRLIGFNVYTWRKSY